MLRRVITKSDIAAFEKERAIITLLPPGDRAEVGSANPPLPMTVIVPKAGATQPQLDDYVTQVVKYIPAEIVAAFLAIDGILKAATGISSLTIWIVFVALLILAPVYTWHATKLQGLPPAWAQIGVSTAGFVVWVFALGGPFAQLSWYNSIYGSILLILFTLIPPLLIGNKPQPHS